MPVGLLVLAGLFGFGNFSASLGLCKFAQLARFPLLNFLYFFCPLLPYLLSFPKHFLLRHKDFRNLGVSRSIATQSRHRYCTEVFEWVKALTLSQLLLLSDLTF